jgi:hypothetical protein
MLIIAFLQGACANINPKAGFDVLSVDDFYPQAYRLAQNWSSVSVLVEVNGVIAMDHELAKRVSSLTYIFETTDKPFTLYKVICLASECEGQEVDSNAADVHNQDLLTKSRNPIDLTSIKLDSIEAVSIGEFGGGFRCALANSNQVWAKITLGDFTVSRTHNIEKLVWVIDFFCPDWIKFRIDPFTGDVLTMERMPSEE